MVNLRNVSRIIYFETGLLVCASFIYFDVILPTLPDKMCIIEKSRLIEMFKLDTRRKNHNKGLLWNVEILFFDSEIQQP